MPGDHRPLHQRHHRRAHHALGVDAGGAHAGDVVELEPVEALHHQHPPGHEARVWSRDDVAGLAEVVQHPRDVDHVGRLDAEVELLDDRVGEQLDEGRGVGQRGDGDAADEPVGEPRHRREVVVHEAVDGRALHLHHHPLAGHAAWRRAPGRSRPRRAAPRRSRRRRWRGGRPRSSSMVARTSGHGSGGTWSRQRLNSSTSSGGEQPLAGGQDLAELDVRRAERLGGEAQAPGEVGGVGGADRAVLPPAPPPASGPGADGRRQPSADGQPAATRRQSPRLHERRHLGPGLHAGGVGRGPPRQRIGIEHPRRVVAERTPRRIGRPRRVARRVAVHPSIMQGEA